jgi:predicted phosphohydrolase
MRVFALGDPHLSFARPKPMDVFGDAWTDHPAKIARAWDAEVSDEDLVLVCGDISWAMNLDEVRPDLAFLAERPGQKMLLRGNHDYWWRSISRVRQVLPPGMEALQNDAFRFPGFVLAGARGWTSPRSVFYEEERDGPVYRRELERLRLSLERAGELRGESDDLLVMLHYPPCSEHHEESEVSALLSGHRTTLAVYGHLHGERDHAWAPRGEFHGTVLHFVDVDFTDFRPVEVYRTGPGRRPAAEEGVL